MDEEKKDLAFEAFLREFEPRAPRPLPASEPSPRPDRARHTAAGGLAVLALAASIWFTLRRPTQQRAESVQVQATATEVPPVTLSIFRLTRLAVEDPAKLDATLDEASRHSLPAFRGSKSTLRVLTKE
jgi:hypothetical protein